FGQRPYRQFAPKIAGFDHGPAWHRPSKGLLGVKLGCYAARYSLRPSRSSAAKSWSDSVIFTAATFSSRCATFDVPGIGSMTGLRLSTQASAIWLGVASWTWAMSSRMEPLLARSPA